MLGSKQELTDELIRVIKGNIYNAKPIQELEHLLNVVNMIPALETYAIINTLNVSQKVKDEYVNMYELNLKGE